MEVKITLSEAVGVTDKPEAPPPKQNGRLRRWTDALLRVRDLVRFVEWFGIGEYRRPSGYPKLSARLQGRPVVSRASDVRLAAQLVLPQAAFDLLDVAIRSLDIRAAHVLGHAATFAQSMRRRIFRRGATS